MDDDKWINVDPRTKKLSLRFRVRGFSRQFYLSTGLTDNRRNREILRSKRDAIANDIIFNRFDDSLNSYRPKRLLAKESKESKLITQHSLFELWEKFTQFQEKQLEETTTRHKYKVIAVRIKKFPSQLVEDAPKIRDWLLANYSQFSVWETLIFLNRCCEWAVGSGYLTFNPFVNLQIKKPKRKSTKEDDYKAYNIEQRDFIIKAFELDHVNGHYADLIKFLFFTGCRHGEAFALRWSDIHSNCTRIKINKARNLFNIQKGTKNGKRRTFPCQQGSKLQSLLIQLRENANSSDDLIFRSKAGFPMNSDILGNCWRQSSCGLGVVRQLANGGKLPYLKPYSTRHTFATLAITSGVTPDKVALWIGDDVATVLKFYCHPESLSAECPDF
ncbi:tyrosine-type recombinase/integrase [Halotia branconii]|uniref:Tyrosine-type recombinase/integrase n=1 Tax=Halotia branconii CENA392 TaxID=1539056 RepID=A0AAJ6NSE4_9CYAN|nr:tyrosine-type recombinase/integrase [Halotia branconii]WGV25688.1 tyrosine-type recombinase/integrase [Halotia branconii CENA392]